MDSNNERNVPDISFGSGAPAGTLDGKDRNAQEGQTAAPEGVSLAKPAAPAAPAPVNVPPVVMPEVNTGSRSAANGEVRRPVPDALRKEPRPGNAPARRPSRPAGDISANFGSNTPEPVLDTDRRRDDIAMNFGSSTPGAAPDKSRRQDDITMNFGSNTTGQEGSPLRGDITANFGRQNAEGEDKTRSFVKPPHSAVPLPADGSEDKTRSFTRTAEELEDAPVPERKPVRKRRPVKAPETAAAAEAEGETAETEQPRPAPRRRRKPRKKKKEHMFNTSIITGLTITIVVISASIVLATQGITLGMEYLGYNKSDKEVTFNIPEGADSEQIIDLLMENNIIKNKTLFKAALRFSDVQILYPGDVTLSPSKSYPEIINTIGTQRELYETVTLTFEEGTNLRAVAAKLEKNGVCTAKDFLWQFNKKLDLPLDSKISHSSEVYLDMEGYFFPDTYEFYKNDSAYNVSKIVRENFDSKITPEMYARMNELGMDLNQVITLASIVQWEAGSNEQMPIIASVFLNRLKDPQTFPNLQSDATARYVTKVIDRVETSTAMLEHYKNVYDTYVCFGLPAGPVCNPGLEAINAVLYPADTKYYYFCNNLDTKEAFYAETYEQHQKNLKKAGLTE